VRERSIFLMNDHHKNVFLQCEVSLHHYVTSSHVVFKYHVFVYFTSLSSFFNKKTKFSIEWPSGWVEPELGRPTLGLGRVGHRPLARRVEPSAPLLSGRIGRVRVLFRRVESNKNFCPLERSTRDCCMSRNSSWAFNSRVECSFWGFGLSQDMQAGSGPSSELARVPWT
jgi:hypothetical protein